MTSAAVRPAHRPACEPFQADTAVRSADLRERSLVRPGYQAVGLGEAEGELLELGVALGELEGVLVAVGVGLGVAVGAGVVGPGLGLGAAVWTGAAELFALCVAAGVVGSGVVAGAAPRSSDATDDREAVGLLLPPPLPPPLNPLATPPAASAATITPIAT